MKVIYHNRKRIAPELERRTNASYVAFDELLAQSDFIVLQVPYSPETHHLIGAAQLKKMKPSAILINSTRGGVVDDAALVAALKDGTIRAAGLDVYENEPKLHPEFLKLDNVVLAPHIGSASVETRTAMADLAARNVLAVLAGHPPLTAVRFRMTIGGTRPEFTVPVVYRWVDPVMGERYRAVEVVPPVTMRFDQGAYLFADATPRPVRVTVQSADVAVEGALTLKLPAGWTAGPASIAVRLAGGEADTTVRFMVTPGAGPAAGAVARGTDRGHAGSTCCATTDRRRLWSCRD